MPLMLIGTLLLNIPQPTQIFSRIKSYLWQLMSIPIIIKKRKTIQNKRIVADKEITSYWSGQVINPEKGRVIVKPLIKLLNKISVTYCLLTKIPTLESIKNK